MYRRISLWHLYVDGVRFRFACAHRPKGRFHFSQLNHTSRRDRVKRLVHSLQEKKKNIDVILGAYLPNYSVPFGGSHPALWLVVTVVKQGI